jgi:hypothetical protein
MLLQSEASTLDHRISQSRGVRNDGGISLGGCQSNRVQARPGLIKPGSLINDIVAHEDWAPTLLAAAGDPGVKEKLTRSFQATGKTFNRFLICTGLRRVHGSQMLRLSTFPSWTCVRRPIRWRLGTSGRDRLCLSMKKDHGIVQDERGQDQPKDKQTAQKAGLKEQREAAKQQTESPGEPAGGE